MRVLQKQKTRNAWITAAVFDVVAIAAIVCLLLALVATAQADCVVAFYSPSCPPCMQQKPTEEKLQAEGYDIRLVNIQERPALARAYRVGRIPCVIFVQETPYGNYEMGRLVGLQTEANLRAFCQPRAALINVAPVANAVRSVLGWPLLIGY